MFTKFCFYFLISEPSQIIAMKDLFISTNLPQCETWSTQKMSTWFDPDVLVILCTNLTELECRAHLTVQFILLLSHTDMVLICRLLK